MYVHVCTCTSFKGFKRCRRDIYACMYMYIFKKM